MVDVSVEDFVTGYLVVCLLLLLISFLVYSTLLWLICYLYSLIELSGSFEDVSSNTVVCFRGIPNFHGKTFEVQIDEEESLIEGIPA